MRRKARTRMSRGCRRVGDGAGSGCRWTKAICDGADVASHAQKRQAKRETEGEKSCVSLSTRTPIGLRRAKLADALRVAKIFRMSDDCRPGIDESPHEAPPLAQHLRVLSFFLAFSLGVRTLHGPCGGWG